MSHRYLGALHPSVTASGVPVAPGDPVAATAVDPDNEHDRHLIEDGLLIDTNPKSKDGGEK